MNTTSSFIRKRSATQVSLSTTDCQTWLDFIRLLFNFRLCFCCIPACSLSHKYTLTWRSRHSDKKRKKMYGEWVAAWVMAGRWNVSIMRQQVEIDFLSRDRNKFRVDNSSHICELLCVALDNNLSPKLRWSVATSSFQFEKSSKTFCINYLKNIDVNLLEWNEALRDGSKRYPI